MAHYTGGGSYNGGANYGSQAASSSQANSTAQPQTGLAEGAAGETKGQKGASILFTVLMSFFFVFLAGVIGYATLDEGVFRPQKLNTATYKAGIYLEDETGLLETEELTAAMEAFLSETGVSPGVEIIRDFGTYGSLERYALHDYYRLFRDERHWLIVVLVPAGSEEADMSEWYWASVLGDECDPAISSASEKRFVKIVQENLERQDGLNVGIHLADAYTAFTQKAMKPQVTVWILLFGTALTILFLFFVWLIVRNFLTWRKKERQANKKMIKCAYCGTRYDAAALDRCPECRFRN